MTAPAFDTCHLVNTALVRASEHILLSGGARREIQLTVTVGLLHHPTAGWGLFDTGSAPRIADVTRRLPFSLYPRVVRSTPAGAGSIVAALPEFGLSADDIRWIVVSHFHADHVAGLHDFPHARLITTSKGLAFARSFHGWRALQHGLIPDLLPHDFGERATLIDQFTGPALDSLGVTHDLFGDGSALLVPLPGHARGQVGMLARTPGGSLLFAADGSYLSRGIRENRAPHWITTLFVDDMRAVRLTVASLHAFARKQPDVLIVPTHCPDAFAAWSRA